jgi:hypothetical protein
MLAWIMLDRTPKRPIKAKLACGYCKQHGEHAENCLAFALAHEDEAEFTHN